MTTGDATVQVFRSEAELDGMREHWLRLQGASITAHPDYFLAGLRDDEAQQRPHVVALERGGEAAAMLVARLEATRRPVRLGPKSVRGPALRSLTVVHGGILGEPSEGDFRLLVDSLRGSLAAGEADLVTFQYVPVDAPYYRLATQGVGFLGREHLVKTEVHWRLELADSFEGFLGTLSSSWRKNLRKNARRLAAEFEDVELRCFTEADEVETFFRDAGVVAARSYQHALGVALGNAASYDERARAGAAQGWFRSYVLYLDGTPAAYQYGDLFGTTYRGVRTGYDSDFAKHGVGTYLHMRVLEDLIEQGARTFDYGVGGADYKESFASHSEQEGKLILYAPTVRARLINLQRTALMAGDSLLRSVAGGERIRRAKQFRRQRLQQHQTVERADT